MTKKNNFTLYHVQRLNRAELQFDRKPNDYVSLHRRQYLPSKHICITCIQRRSNVFDVGPTLHKCYTNGLCLWGLP